MRSRPSSYYWSTCYYLLLAFGLCNTQRSHAIVDLDSDGLSDLWETRYDAQDLLPLEDNDEDGVINLLESAHGTDPLDGSSYFEVSPPEFENGLITIRWHADTEQIYIAESSADLSGWNAIENAIPLGENELMAQFDTSEGPVFVCIQIPDDSDFDGLSDYEEFLIGFSPIDHNTSVLTPGGDMAEAVRLLSSGEQIQLAGQTFQTDLPTSYEASRFLMQATLGANEEEINRLVSMGYEAWLAEQWEADPGFIEPEIDERIANELDTWSSHRRHAWWRQIMTSNDLLRQRIAVALSEVYVISDETINNEEGIAHFYDMLLRNAFGNWRDLLSDVSLHPIMGQYLSHLGNRKADPEAARFPDENYAREIMQLFSIGLYELNTDGTHKTDTAGNSIPTYGNTEIKEFARVFTGFAWGGPANDTETPWQFFWGEHDPDEPMKIWSEQHDEGEKTLLNGTVLPSFEDDPERTAMDDFNAAIDNLFEHPNVGPFIAKRLIQRLVTSNPSPAYLRRVSQVFNDNGLGIRGDMLSVVKAILMDAEARAMPGLNSEKVGRLREPYLRWVRLLRTFNASAPSGDFLISDWGATDSLGQAWMSAPSVFNFFLPDFTPLGELNEQEMTGPEFQILNSSTALSSLNYISSFTSEYGGFSQDDEDQVLANLDTEFALAEDLEALIERLNLLLTYGTMTEQTKTTLTTAFEQMPNWYDDDEKVRALIQLASISPDFSVFQ